MAQKIIRINRGAGGAMATGKGAKLSKSYKKVRLWRLWSGSEVIATNWGAGGAMATGKKQNCVNHCKRGDSGGSGMAQKL